LRSFAYFVLVRLVGVLTGRGSVSQLQLENAVLRHQVKVLRRTISHPELKVKGTETLDSACDQVFLRCRSTRSASAAMMGDPDCPSGVAPVS
jgi:hypothetical protein